MCKKENAFTLRANEQLEELRSTEKLYGYDGDRLISYDGEECSYNSAGVPVTYRGKPVIWRKVTQLIHYNGTVFEYDGFGRRVKKGNIRYYYDNEGKLIKQSNGIQYIYDKSGVSGFRYERGEYIYRKNAQGDITHILDYCENVVAEYAYDAWGNCTIIKDTAGIAEVNPFRYRGYYYDAETGLYYLKTRYYDPEVGRFISQDDVSYLDPEHINGLNLYAYCGNNPVMFTDPNGTSFLLTLFIGALIAGVVSGAIKATTTAISGGSGMECLGAFAGGFITGVALGGAAILGGGLAVGAVMATTATVLGSMAAVAVGSFAAGVFSYYAENKISGKEIKIDELLMQGGLTALQGLISFGIGAALGASGYWDTLKLGNGLIDIIKNSIASEQSFGKAVFGGLIKYIKLDSFSFSVRTFMQQIFSSPWNLIKP